MLVHDIGRAFEPFLCLVVAVQLVILVAQVEPRSRRVRQHTVQGSRHQLGGVDRRAVKKQFGALVATCTLLRYVCLAWAYVIAQLLPMRFPVAAVRLQRAVSLQQRGCARIIHSTVPKVSFWWSALRSSDPCRR